MVFSPSMFGSRLFCSDNTSSILWAEALLMVSMTMTIESIIRLIRICEV